MNSQYRTRLTDNSAISHCEVCEQLQALGFQHTDRVPTSGNGRIPARGKGPNNRSASVRWTDDYLALQWYEFTSEDHGVISSSNQQNYNREDAANLFQKAEKARYKAEAMRQSLADTAARQAQDRWRAGASTGTHLYITTKQLSGLLNARIEASTGALLIPMWVSGAGLVNLQQIFADGKKLFIKGAKVKGAYSVIGSLNNAERVLVCEGWATGASLFELHGLPVVVAFNAGNLMPVCQSLRSQFKNLTFVIAGDDDRQNAANVGRQKAIEAAEAIGATLLFPELCKACKCTDWNDLSICTGRRAHG